MPRLDSPGLGAIQEGEPAGAGAHLLAGRINGGECGGESRDGPMVSQRWLSASIWTNFVQRIKMSRGDWLLARTRS